MIRRVTGHKIRKSLVLKPNVWIGKNGVSQELLEGIEKQMDKSDTVKIKILRSALKGEQTKRIASKAAEQTKALLVETRGHTFTLYKDSE